MEPAGNVGREQGSEIRFISKRHGSNDARFLIFLRLLGAPGWPTTPHAELICQRTGGYRTVSGVELDRCQCDRTEESSQRSPWHPADRGFMDVCVVAEGSGEHVTRKVVLYRIQDVISAWTSV